MYTHSHYKHKHGRVHVSTSKIFRVRHFRILWHLTPVSPAQLTLLFLVCRRTGRISVPKLTHKTLGSYIRGTEIMGDNSVINALNKNYGG